MATQQLNEVQRALVNDVIRPHIERMILWRAEQDQFLLDMANQQVPIANNADDLGDNAAGTAPRADAPKLTGADVAQLVTTTQNMRNQFGDAVHSALVARAVRDVRAILRS